MIASSVRSLCRRIFGLPKSIWYGMHAGLIPGLLWVLYAGLVRLPGPVSASSGRLNQLAVPALMLVPVLVVLATGFRLGQRNGSVVDGLIAGVITGIVFTLILSATLLVIRWSAIQAEAHTDHVSVWLEALAAVVLDVFFFGVMFMLLGLGLGSLGAFIGRICSRRQLAWRKYLTIVAAKVPARLSSAKERALGTRPAPASEDGAPAPMISSSVAALSRWMFGLPKTIVYGLSAGMISGVGWAVMYVVALLDPSPDPLDQLAALLLISWLLLAPVLLVIATGARLGWRNESVRSGLIAGAIAGALFMLICMVSAQLTQPPPLSLTDQARAWHTSAAWVLIIILIYHLIYGLIVVVVGAVLGALGALGGRWWRRRGQRAWRTSTAAVSSRIATSRLYMRAFGCTVPHLVQPDDAPALVSSTFVIFNMEQQPIAGDKRSELSVLPE